MKRQLAAAPLLIVSLFEDVVQESSIIFDLAKLARVITTPVKFLDPNITSPLLLICQMVFILLKLHGLHQYLFPQLGGQLAIIQ